MTSRHCRPPLTNHRRALAVRARRRAIPIDILEDEIAYTNSVMGRIIEVVDVVQILSIRIVVDIRLA